MNTTCVVLDVDDTLYLERDYVRSGFRAVDTWLTEAHALEGFFTTAWALFEDGVRGRTFDRALAELGASGDHNIIAQLVDVYRKHVPAIALLPDAAVLLLKLKDQSLAIVTDGPAASQRAKVRALGIDWIDPVLYTADLGAGAGKPNPMAFRMVESRHHVTGVDCCYIADNPHKDFGGPRSLGWRTIRIRRPGGLHTDAPSGPDVDLEVTSLNDVVEAMHA